MMQPIVKSLLQKVAQVSFPRKFSTILIFIVLFLLIELANFWIDTKILASVRSYVTGEGLWSKAEKEGVIRLLRYAATGDEADYRSYQLFMKVPLGDNIARLELNKRNPDLTIVRNGFIQGGNSPYDVGNLIFLYQWFRHENYMNLAVQDWTNGDSDIAELMSTGEEIHHNVATKDTMVHTQTLPKLINRVSDIDTRLTKLENHFSKTLGTGARWINNLLLTFTVILTLILGSIVLIAGLLIEKTISELDRRKSEFIILASHELKTPLTTIKLYSDLLGKKIHTVQDTQLKKNIVSLTVQVNRFEKLVSDLLDVSRIDTGKLPLHKENFRLDTLMHEVIETLAVSANGRKVVLYKNGGTTVHGDRARISQVIANLLTNAHKYSPPEKHIIIQLKISGRMVRCSVQDFGNGIKKEDRERIFDRLYQGNGDAEKKHPGLGMGLFISREIITQHNGRLWVKSSIGKGSTFHFEIPRVKSKRS